MEGDYVLLVVTVFRRKGFLSVGMEGVSEIILFFLLLKGCGN